jgi:glycosyltransferase involved in cell wall biosynthesis
VRLLFLTAETFPTFRADVAVLFGKYLPRHGIYSDLVTGRASEKDGALTWGGGDALLCELAGGQARRHIKTLLHGLRCLFMADRRRYDAFQVRDMAVLGTCGLVAARLKGLPFIYWMSFPQPEAQILRARERRLSDGLMKLLFPWVQGRVGRFLLYRAILPHATHVFVQSERMKQDLVKRGVPSEKMTPVPMGVDIEAVQALCVAPSDDPRLVGRRALVYLGTLDRVRRIETLFPMLAIVRQKVPEALLVLVGDTEDASHRGWLEEQAAAAGVAQHVVWTGWLPTDVAWRYVRAAKVGLSPIPRGTLLDCGSPTKVPEYLILGLPVVCNDNPDQKRVIEVTGAGRCVPYTAEAFAAAATALLLESELGESKALSSGIAYVNEFRSYERISLNVTEAYRRVGE